MSLPIGLRYKSQTSCNGLSMSNRILRSRIEDTIQALNMCRGHCSVNKLESFCVDNENESGSEIEVTFHILIKNPEENAISASCDPLCKRRNMRQMLRETFFLKNAVQRLVGEKPTEFQLGDHTAPTLDKTSFSFKRPEMLCEGGRVFTRNRLCGTFRY